MSKTRLITFGSRGRALRGRRKQITSGPRLKQKTAGATVFKTPYGLVINHDTPADPPAVEAEAEAEAAEGASDE
jgi:hypothetical protein